MAEQRLIDSNADVSQYVETWTCNCSDYGVQNVMAVDDISTLLEIDPETLPIVRQLREELANCKQELRQIKYCYDIAKNGEKRLRKQKDETMALWAECAKKLKQVTAERDAAVKDLNEFLAMDELCPIQCEWCKWKDTFCDGKTPEWRGVQNE